MNAINFGFVRPGMNTLLDTIFDGVRAFGDPKIIAPFPHYDIIQNSETEFSIELAIAGYRPEDVSIQLQDRTLLVSGKRPAAPEANYLHRGIAGRSFEKPFRLVPYVEVDGASYEHGILKIALTKRVPEAKQARKIEINAEKTAVPVATDEAPAT